MRIEVWRTAPRAGTEVVSGRARQCTNVIVNSEEMTDADVE